MWLFLLFIISRTTELVIKSKKKIKSTSFAYFTHSRMKRRFTIDIGCPTVLHPTVWFRFSWIESETKWHTVFRNVLLMWNLAPKSIVNLFYSLSRWIKLKLRQSAELDGIYSRIMNVMSWWRWSAFVQYQTLGVDNIPKIRGDAMRQPRVRALAEK